MTGEKVRRRPSGRRVRRTGRRLDTDEDVRERIERSFGEGPAQGPVTDLLEQGHRALRGTG